MNICLNCKNEYLPKKYSNAFQKYCSKVCKVKFYLSNDVIHQRMKLATRKWRADYKDKVKVYNEKPSARYCTNKSRAKKRGYKFELTKEQFLILIDKDCHYCGESSVIKYGLGIDRLNNNIGYVVSNCVPCCYMCNVMKHINSELDFIKHCKRITEHSQDRLKNLLAE